MSTSEVAERQDEPAHIEHEHAHPSDSKYVLIAIILAVITAAEVATYYVDLSTAALIIVLSPMMIAKFALVVAFFMHLKFDSRIFTRLFVAGLVLAVLVYLVALSTFGFLVGGD